MDKISQETPQKATAKRAKIPAILLNADFYTKGRNIRWIKDNGYEAVLILQAVWIASSQERDCKISKEDAYNIPFLLSFPDQKVIDVLESAIKVGLINADDDFYWNSQIVEDSDRFQAKRDNYSAASKKREAKFKQNSNRILPEFRQNHIEYEYDPEYETDTEKIKKEIATPPPPPDYSELPPERKAVLELAEGQLVPSDDPKIQKHAHFINAGRRPMRKYSEIWLTPFELADAIEILETKGIPKNQFKLVFSACASRIRGYVAEGRDAARTPVFSWLTGFALEQALKTLKAEKDLKRSENYLTNSEGGI